MVTNHAAGPDWDGHLLLLHGSEAERLAGLTAWGARMSAEARAALTFVPQSAHAGFER